MKVYFQTARRGFRVLGVTARGACVKSRERECENVGINERGDTREKGEKYFFRPIYSWIRRERERERENEREREVFDASSDARETRTSHVHPFIRPSISPRGLNADVEEINWIGMSRVYEPRCRVRSWFTIEEKHSKFLQLRLEGSGMCNVDTTQ